VSEIYFSTRENVGYPSDREVVPRQHAGLACLLSCSAPQRLVNTELNVYFKAEYRRASPCVTCVTLPQARYHSVSDNVTSRVPLASLLASSDVGVL
jgi:hypothetical protein